MTEHLKRDLNVSQKAMKEMQRELTECRRLLSDVYHLLPKNEDTAYGTRIAREAIQSFLQERGLLK